MDTQDAWIAQLSAAGALVVITAIFYVIGPKRGIAKQAITFVDGQGKQWNFNKGGTIDTELMKDARFKADFIARNYVSVQRGVLFRSLYAGQDGRWSTSKIQPLLWTYAIVFGLTSILIAKFLGEPAGWNAQLDGLQEEYLILLGGPFAAAVLAKISTTAKVEQGGLDKDNVEHPPDNGPVESLGQGLSEVVRDDNGNVDLGDFQYFLFNLLALTFFFGTFVANLENGLPDLPDLLVGLTGVSAAAYVAKKATEGATPSITQVIPAKASPGSKIVLWGQNLVARDADPSRNEPTVTINDVKSTEVDVDTAGSRHRLTVRVPLTCPIGEGTINVVTASGIAASVPDGGLAFEVITGVQITDVRPSKIPRQAGQTVQVLGAGFVIAGAGANSTRIEVDGVDLEGIVTTSDGLSVTGTITPAVAGQLSAKPQANLVVKNSLGHGSAPYLVELL